MSIQVHLHRPKIRCLPTYIENEDRTKISGSRTFACISFQTHWRNDLKGSVWKMWVSFVGCERISRSGSVSGNVESPFEQPENGGSEWFSRDEKCTASLDGVWRNVGGCTLGFPLAKRVPKEKRVVVLRNRMTPCWGRAQVVGLRGLCVCTALNTLRLASGKLCQRRWHR